MNLWWWFSIKAVYIISNVWFSDSQRTQALDRFLPSILYGDVTIGEVGRPWRHRKNGHQQRDFLESLTVAMAEALTSTPEAPPEKKKAKRQCHFVDSWIKEYPGIVRSEKGKWLKSQ